MFFFQIPNFIIIFFLWIPAFVVMTYFYKNLCEKLIIDGGTPLKGQINISGAKNAVLPIMTASILTDKLHITNVLKLTDVSTMKDLLKSHGASHNEVVKHLD